MLPDNLFLQEFLRMIRAGIVRLEFLDGELLYAMCIKTRASTCVRHPSVTDEGGAR